MKKSLLILAAFAGALVTVSGCRPIAEDVEGGTRTVVTGHQGGAYAPKNTTRFDLENDARFVLLDYPSQRGVSCSGIQEKLLEDGRLQVSANIRNRLEKRNTIQLNCVFKDEQGFPTGDETPFQTLILSENAQEGVQFVSMNNKAKKYTIRVRQVR